MTRPCVSREELVDLLGEAPIPERTLTRIVETGATFDEVGEAIDDLERERKLGERRIPASLEVAAVREILEELAEGGPAQEPVVLLSGAER
jgi:hypothetical protein